MDVAKQVSHEAFNHARKNRRRTYQSVLSFDVFLKLLRDKKPDFCSLFTNHVASAMHRFWAASYPKHYKQFDMSGDWVKKYNGEIDFAMKKTDRLLQQLIKFMQKNPEYTLWIVSSMGQEATQAYGVDTQVSLKDPQAFMRFLGMPDDAWEVELAMFPQFNFVVSEDKRDLFRSQLKSIMISGAALTFRETHNFFSLDFGQENLRNKVEYAIVNQQKTPFAKMGLSNMEIDEKCATTAYHIPKGCLLIYDPSSRKLDTSRTQISTTDIAPQIINNFGLKKPAYMNAAFLGF